MSVRIIDAQEAMEGAGVRIRRSIGSAALGRLDPFLMLDYFDSERPTDYLAGFPTHPHRGFTTLTYMLEGRMEHQDSMGHRGVIGPGAVQWMKAASGVIHSEMPHQVEGRMAGFQLWINLPASEKMSAPAYQEYPAESFSVVHEDGRTIKLLAGRYGDSTGPIDDPHSQLAMVDVALDAGAAFDWPLETGHQAFLFAYHGEGTIDGRRIAAGQLAALSDCAAVDARQDLHFIAASGQPIGEPVVQRGPFVMNSSAQIEQALRDYRDGQLVQKGNDQDDGKRTS